MGTKVNGWRSGPHLGIWALSEQSAVGSSEIESALPLVRVRGLQPGENGFSELNDTFKH